MKSFFSIILTFAMIIIVTLLYANEQESKLTIFDASKVDGILLRNKSLKICYPDSDIVSENGAEAYGKTIEVTNMKEKNTTSGYMRKFEKEISYEILAAMSDFDSRSLDTKKITGTIYIKYGGEGRGSHIRYNENIVVTLKLGEMKANLKETYCDDSLTFNYQDIVFKIIPASEECIIKKSQISHKNRWPFKKIDNDNSDNKPKSNGHAGDRVKGK